MFFPFALILLIYYSSLARVDYDHIEVSLEDPSAIASATDEDSKDILTRANDFFLEYNDNYTMNWKEAIELDQDLEVDPSKPPQPGVMIQSFFYLFQPYT